MILSQNIKNVQQRLRYPVGFFEYIYADICWKMPQSGQQKVECQNFCRFLTFSVIFHLKLETLERQKFPKGTDSITTFPKRNLYFL